VRGSFANILTIARREFLFRGRGRMYLVSTLILVVVAIGVAVAPIVVRYFSQNSEPERIGLAVGSVRLAVDPVTILDHAMNGTVSVPSDGSTPAPPSYAIVPMTDLDAARQQVVAGKISAVLALDRSASGDLAFTLFTKRAGYERVPQILRQAATAIAIQDRLDRLGIAPGDQVAVFASAPFEIRSADPGTTGGPGGPNTITDFVGDYVVGFALTIFIFMAIMLYGQWVAMSVAEEKNSRVMEVILGAASPFQLLAGKVLGVGGLAMLQYAIVFIPASLAIVFQDRIASFVLGGAASSDLPAGLTIDLLAVFGILLVLGFGLYAVLYAGAASLVSRQDDVNQVVLPLTLLSTAGYMVAAYAGSGLIDLGSPVMRIVSFFPLLSPYLILTRLGLRQITPIEVVLAIVILVVTIAGALWFAARIYRVGVLMYGQKPGLRAMVRAFRSAGT
jgi:ABC-2 type transport system permease protein